MTKLPRIAKFSLLAVIVASLMAAVPVLRYYGSLSGSDTVDTFVYDTDGERIDYTICASGTGNNKLTAKLQIPNPYTGGLTWLTQRTYKLRPGQSVSASWNSGSWTFFHDVRFRLSRKPLTKKLNWEVRID